MIDFKIYILPVEKELMLETQFVYYPIHNKRFYSVEQDFFTYLSKHTELLTDDPEKAAWHYLPVYWTNYYGFRKHSRKDIPKLQHQVDSVIIDDSKTFTVVQYNPGPLVDLRKTILFLASRRSEKGIDIPLLCDGHEISKSYEKQYLACFGGLMWTHKIRSQLAGHFREDRSVNIKEIKDDAHLFVDMIMESYIALCPRGTGGDSFRFYEAMELGVVPFSIGDIDPRPFKKFIDWDQISFYATNVKEVGEILDSYRNNLDELLEKGAKAKQVYENELGYQKWCKYIFEELRDIK